MAAMVPCQRRERRRSRREPLWKGVTDVIRAGRSFAVTSHTYPDGDSVGSMVALLRLLRGMGKSAVGVNPAPVPPAYRFMVRRGDVITCGGGAAARALAGADALFILDASTDDRLGAVHGLSMRAGLTRVCIDHHPGNVVGADVKVVRTEASSTAELIYDLHGACGRAIDRETALALYTGIHTDTVSFNFLGANARTHELAAALIRAGVDPAGAWIRIYGNDSPRLLRLAGDTLAGIRTADGGRIVWLEVRARDWHRRGVDPAATESFTRFPLTVRGAGAIAVFCEERRGRVRVSMRALDATDVGRIARGFGGGGHRTSAGAVIGGPFERVVRDVIRALRARRAGRRG
ncbi:MAG: DHH family phosphoesterase [bacterium]|nr:DHH family phosphoesterase [bacterium]